MRVSSEFIYQLLVKYDRERSKVLSRKVEELSSGREILKPSDSPVDFARSLRLERFSKKLERLNKNIELVSSYLDSAESFVNSAVTTLEGVRVKIIQLLNSGILNNEDAQVLTDFFKSARNYILQLGNQKEGDSYLFGGVKTQTPPFSQDGTYQGATQETTVPVADGVEVNTNFNGKEYFAVNRASNKALAVEVLDKIVELLEAGDFSRLQSDTITVDLGNGSHSMKLLDAFDAALSKMSQYRSILGTKQRTVENLKLQNESINLRFKELHSKLVDADYPEAVAQYQKAKTAYEALLAAVSQVQKETLL